MQEHANFCGICVLQKRWTQKNLFHEATSFGIDGNLALEPVAFRPPNMSRKIHLRRNPAEDKQSNSY